MMASAQRTLTALSIATGDGALVCLHPDYIAGKMMLVRALEFNLKIEAVEPSSDPLRMVSEDFLPGLAAIVPLQLQSMIDQPQRVSSLNRMKAILVGGAAVSEMLHQKIRLLKCPVYATYGMTETISNIALQRLNGSTEELFFRTLPGITVRIDDRGCLVVSLQEMPQPIVTNDVAELVSETTFRVLGRWDYVINSGGIKISPETLEERSEKLIRDVGIVSPYIYGSILHEALGEALVLILEGEPLPHQTETKLLESLKHELRHYEVPRQIRYVTKFTYTPSGKINRPEILKNIR